MKREYHRERLCILLEKEMSAAYRCVDYLHFCEKVSSFRPVEDTENAAPSGRKCFNRMDRRRIGEWFFGGKFARSNGVNATKSPGLESRSTRLCIR